MIGADTDILNLMENVRVLQNKNNEYEKRINVLEDGIINIKITLPPKTMNFGELTRFKLDDGWFSVRDRLPDEGEVVLVFGSSIDEWDKKEKHHVAVCEIVQHRWFEKDETPQKISHWRYIPNPPELSTSLIIQKQPVANNSTNQV